MGHRSSSEFFGEDGSPLFKLIAHDLRNDNPGPARKALMCVAETYDFLKDELKQFVERSEMSANMPEQPKFVQLDKRWKPRGAHITTTVPWDQFVTMLKETGRIKETDNVAAVYVYAHGITLDLR